MDLLPHNRAAYNAVLEALETSSRTCVIHPTGTGKSYITMEYIEEHPDESILFITSYLTTLSRFAADCKRLLGAEVFSHLDLAIYAGLGKGKVYDPESLIDKYQKNTALPGKISETGYKTIILDEFHRVGADTWEQQVRRQWAVLLLGSLQRRSGSLMITGTWGRKSSTEMWRLRSRSMTL